MTVIRKLPLQFTNCQLFATFTTQKSTREKPRRRYAMNCWPYQAISESQKTRKFCI